MSLLDDIFGAEKKGYKNKPTQLPNQLRETSSPISMSIRFLPVRLAARKDNRIDMIVKISNETGEKQLVSFEALAPRGQMLGFDATVVSKQYEKKLGQIEPGATSEFAVTVYGTTQTRPETYELDVTAYVHFSDYNKVVNYVKRKVALRVV
ncbi:MAG: hypothetical protein PHS02_00925 [Candidatus ainarchaeum sp.]|nr:hypothetical protein [Candidatus ainarchaeum sp.]